MIVYGVGRYGSHLARRLVESDVPVLAVDWDPYATRRSDGFDVVYGDAEDAEFPGSLPLEKARWVVSTMPRADSNRHLAAALDRWGYDGRLAVLAISDADAVRLQDLDADLVLTPYRDAARLGVERILDDLGVDR